MGLRATKLAEATPFKRQVYYALEDIAGGKTLARIFGIALFLLILANAAMVFITTELDFDEVTMGSIGWFYSASTICFLVEYIFRFYVADLVYPHLPPKMARLRYAVSLFGIIDLLSFLPNMITWFLPVSSFVLNAILVLRLVRLIKLSRYMRGLRTIGRVLKKRRSEIIASYLVLALLLVICSILMYQAEHEAQPDVFNSLFTGVYWAVVTITSTGYGDIVPITAIGRFIGSITMLLSVGIIAIPGGILSAGFVAEYQSERHHRALDEEEEE